jgi:hypothetical protein
MQVCTTGRRRLAPGIALLLMACSAGEGTARDQGAGDGSPPSGATSQRTDANAGHGAAGSTASGASGSAAQGGALIDEECAAISQAADNQLQPADIVFAIDNSGSMDEEIVFVREQLNAFSQQIVDSGIDVRIIVISAATRDPSAPPSGDGDNDNDDDDQDNGICIDAPLGSGSCPDDSSAPRYLHVAREVKSHDALDLFIETFPRWRDQLRPNATKTFVVVTDDNAEDEIASAAAFTRAVAELDPVLFATWSFSGIYCFSECPEAAEIGAVYRDLVAQTMGVGGDLCLQDFAPVFDALARSVIGASRLDCAWAIPDAPAGQTFAVGQVNVQYTAAGTSAPESIYYVESPDQCGAQGGWYYDDNGSPSRLLVCPSTCERLQADGRGKLDVLFGCETKDGPD